MTSEYSISINDWKDEQWRFTGRELEESKSRKELEGDDYYPMMNYAYPLYHCPSEEQIRKIHKQTCLTVVEDNNTGDFFLALCGGGMDFSQDIAMAYILAGQRLPYALAINVCRQPNISQHGKDFRRVMKECKAEIESVIASGKYQIEEIDKSISDSLAMEKNKLHHISQLRELREKAIA